MTAFAATLGLSAAIWLAAMGATAFAVSVAWRFVRRATARRHPADRAAAAFAAATASAFVPTVLLAALLAPGVVGIAVPGVDHCAAHPEHTHLCLAHPAAALSPRVAFASLAAFGALAALAAASGYRATVAGRPLRALARHARRDPSRGLDVVDSDRPFALTHGLARARTLVSITLADALSPRQLAAVAAHEAEHARRRDPLRQLVARVCSAPLPPRVRRDVLDSLALGSEQACDEAAALRIGDRVAVAEAILAVEAMMLTAGGGRPAVISGIGGSSVPERVSNLLDASTSRARWGAGAALVALAFAAAVAAAPLHHEAEHLLARILGAR